ncbi:segregation and condensation protein B [Rhizobium sp. Leaf371]|uniref:SMC-Scp complex subunit ScpB n=1 Tax=Rhizobium sp. Leaf371 TaxID=1736355 RepID=UPI0007139DDF|nr:SMC-Scp complex subunit ScpB [Rhizobium sp. Leaf371]KQS59405.1 segregation and condensation protein B [Rhizobium sp. Leaf371]
MTGSSTPRSRRRPDKGEGGERLYDRELEDLPPELRWREWMLRVEAVIFASAEPVSRETLARAVGRDCSIDLLIDDLIEELGDRPYELVSVAGGWQHRTRPRFADTIRASMAPTRGGAAALSEFEAMVLMAVGYFQPVTRGELSKIFGREISRDTIGNLRGSGFIGSGPRSPTPGAPYTYVTTRHFLSAFGFETLRDLPDIEMLEDAGLMRGSKTAAALSFGESPSDDGEADEA